LKGTAYVVGEKGEIDKMAKDYEDKKPPPSMVVQSISNVVFSESVLHIKNTEHSTADTASPIGEGIEPQGAKPAEQRLQRSNYRQRCSQEIDLEQDTLNLIQMPKHKDFTNDGRNEMNDCACLSLGLSTSSSVLRSECFCLNSS
jgi:hypothetical protein